MRSITLKIASIVTLSVFLAASLGMYVEHSECNCSGKTSLKLYSFAEPHSQSCCELKTTDMGMANGQSCHVGHEQCCMSESVYIHADLKFTVSEGIDLPDQVGFEIVSTNINIVEENTSPNYHAIFTNDPKPPGFNLLIIDYIHKTNPDPSYYA